MRVLFICGAGLVSGKENQTLSTMVQLRKTGHEVHCIMSVWGSPRFAELLEANQITYEKLRLGFISKTLTWDALRMTSHQFLFLPGLWIAYRRVLKSFRPDAVIHTNFHHLFLLLPVLGTALQVFYAHDRFPPSRFFKKLFAMFDRRVQLFVAVSEFIRRDLLNLGIVKEKTQCVYNGVTILNDTPPVISKRDKVGVGIVGQIGPWKGHRILFDAIIPLFRIHPSLELVVVGTGSEEYVSELRSILVNENVVDRVRFTGRVDGVRAIYSQFDILCVPSLIQEAFGLVAVEAGMCGLPVVCADSGGLPEVIEDGVSGIVVKAGDVDQTRNALDRLIVDVNFRIQLGRNGHSRAVRIFNIERSTEELSVHLREYAINLPG